MLNEERKKVLAGAYFKLQRNKKNLSLSKCARDLNIQKSFLSELENGKRHFPEGMIQELNNYYQTSFLENDEPFLYSIEVLENAFKYLFFDDEVNEIKVLNEAINKKVSYFQNYAYFVFQIIMMFYYMRVENDDFLFSYYRTTIEENISVYAPNEISIYYCLIGIYCKKNSKNLKKAVDYFELSNQNSSPTSYVFAMNSFQIIGVQAMTAHPAIALGSCYKTRDILKNFNNYWKMLLIDLYECHVLTLLKEYDNSIALAERLLSNINQSLGNERSILYQCIGMNYLFMDEYEKCIQAINCAGEYKEHLTIIIAYSLYRLNDINECKEVILKEQKRSKEDNDFMNLITLIVDGKTNIKKEISKCYKKFLEEKDFEKISLVLKIMVDFYEKSTEREEYIKVLEDYILYDNNELTVTSSHFLND